MKKTILGVLVALSAVACTVNPPSEPSNICSVLDEKRGWFDALANTEEKWGVPMHVTMAMMFQESSFVYDAQPPMDYVLGVVPWGRISSAYGYAQAKDEVWSEYMEAAGSRGAERDDFEAAVDFMGYYMNITAKINDISKSDASGQYLCYHEGWGGCRKGSYKAKPWLMKVAGKVEKRSSLYEGQLASCRGSFEIGWFNIFS